MKKLMTALLLVCASLVAQSLSDKSQNHIKAMRDDGSLTNVVNSLVSDGTFCSIRGHQWEAGCGVNGCLVIHYQPLRHCVTCKQTQTQDVSAWH